MSFSSLWLHVDWNRSDPIAFFKELGGYSQSVSSVYGYGNHIKAEENINDLNLETLFIHFYMIAVPYNKKDYSHVFIWYPIMLDKYICIQ